MEFFLALAFGVLVLLPIIDFALVMGARRRLERAEEESARLKAENERLEGRLRELRHQQIGTGEAVRELREAWAAFQSRQEAPAETAEGPGAIDWSRPSEPASPVSTLGDIAAPAPTPKEPIEEVAAELPESPPELVSPPPLPIPPPIPLPPPIEFPPPPPLPEPQAAPATLSSPTPPPRPPRPPSPPARPSPASPAPPAGFDWEGRIEGFVGVKLFSGLAAVAVVAAGVFFLRYSIDHGWLTPPIRMAAGLLSGIALLIVCELKVARRYPVTANALDAAAIALLFSTFFASHALWRLIPALPTFAFMALVTAVAVLLSVRRDSVFIAVLGLLGGFATPALLSTGEDRPIGLFGYLLLLNAGLAWVAQKKRWPLLTVMSVLLTTLYQWGWVDRFLDGSKLPIAIGVFLVFPILAFASLTWGRGGDAQEPASRLGPSRELFQKSASLSAALPLVFAIYLAAVPRYATSFPLLFGFLFLMALGLFVVSVWRGPETLHLAGAFATLAVFVVWLFASYTQAAWPWALFFLALFSLFNLAAPLAAEPLRRLLPGSPPAAADSKPPKPAASRPPYVAQTETGFFARGRLGAFATPLLFCLFPALIAMEPACASPALIFAVLFGLSVCNAAYAVWRGEGGVHFVGAFAVVFAEAVWSARYLSPERLLQGLVLYAVFALFYLGVPLFAQRLGKPLLPEGSGALLLLISLGLLVFLTMGSVAHVALWGLAILLGLLNAGLFFEGGSGRMPLLTIAGILLSWALLGLWWGAVAIATVTSLLIPALFVVGGFALLVLAGNLWARRRAESDSTRGVGEPRVFDNGLFLALVGHLFLLAVASQASLALPPWPLLGVLFVLDLAIAAAALFVRKGLLHFGALLASAVVLAAFAGGPAERAPWPTVAVSSAVVLAAFAWAFLLLARRMGIAKAPEPSVHTKTDGELEFEFEPFAAGALTCLFAATLIASIAAQASPGPPSYALLVAVHLAAAVSVLRLTHEMAWRPLGLAALFVSFAAIILLPERVSPPGLPGWLSKLVFSGLLYAVFLAYPLVIGQKARRSNMPFLMAALASGIFFLVARGCLMTGGFGDYIGALPVALSGTMAILLKRLLSLEPLGKRNLGRLALVAGAVLAFITVAIPLQLDKEWITIGWALEGAALAWLYSRIPHKGLLGASYGLLVVVFVRLTFNTAVFDYHPRSGTPIWNFYLYTYLVSALAFFLATWFLKDTDDRLFELPRATRVHPALGTILLFLLANIQVADFFSKGPALTFQFTGTSWVQGLAYSLTWAAFAVGLLAAGIFFSARPARIAAIGLLGVTALKVSLIDLASFGGLYRVASLLGLAASLVVVAVLIQKFVLSRRVRE